ncbi:cytochrome P450 [Nocardia niigatensis]
MRTPLPSVESVTTRLARHPWRSAYRRPPATPPGFEPAPLVFTGVDALPVVGVATRLWRTIASPLSLVEDAAEHTAGQPFTIRIPTAAGFDLTYLPDKAGYDTVLSLPARDAKMGPVFGRIPVVGMWFPRRSDDHDSLQDLVLTGKKIMARMLSPEQVQTLPPLVEQVMADRMKSWGASADLAQVLYPAIYEASIRYFAGDQLYSKFGEELISALRAIVDGIDIPRAALAVTPAKYLMREYRYGRRLAAILRRAAAQVPDSPLFTEIRAADVHELDVAWMAMYILWNAVAYPGSYALWSLVDIVTHPAARAELEATDTRNRWLTHCFWETVRLNPISSLVRHLDKPLEYEHAGRRYWLPADTVVGVAPFLLNRSEDTWHLPNHYRPERFFNTVNPRTKLFGLGPFGCVAAEYSRVLITGVLDAVLTARDVTFPGPLPVRRCRVHLTYPSGPVIADLPVRAAKPREVMSVGA